MSGQPYFSDLQLAIMQVLWERGESSVTEVHAALLEERGLAPTTVATLLKRLEKKGVVGHRVDGRQFIYRPAVSQETVRRSMVGQLTSRLFRGDALAMVNHLLSSHDIDAGELGRLKGLIAELEQAEPGQLETGRAKTERAETEQADSEKAEPGQTDPDPARPAKKEGR